MKRTLEEYIAAGVDLTSCIDEDIQYELLMNEEAKRQKTIDEKKED